MEQNYTLQPDVLKELKKLYPKIKIPVDSKHDYYLKTLIKDQGYFDRTIPYIVADLIDLDSKLDKHQFKNISKYKMTIGDNLLYHFQDINMIEQLNNIDLSKLKTFTKKSFENWSEDKIFISIDMKQANWSVFKKYCKPSTPQKFHNNWEDFVTKTPKFDLHEAIAKSKSFRQFVLGNTNPKRLIRLQEHEMQNLIDQLNFQLSDLNIAGKSSDEIIIEHSIKSDNTDNILIQIQNDKHLEEILFAIKHLYLENIELHYNIFTIGIHSNYDEDVKIKTFYSNDLQVQSSELFGVNGNRYFLHFKTLILKDELEEEDLLYTTDKFISKWVI